MSIIAYFSRDGNKSGIQYIKIAFSVSLEIANSARTVTQGARNILGHVHTARSYRPKTRQYSQACSSGLDASGRRHHTSNMSKVFQVFWSKIVGLDCKFYFQIFISIFLNFFSYFFPFFSIFLFGNFFKFFLAIFFLHCWNM